MRYGPLLAIGATVFLAALPAVAQNASSDIDMPPVSGAPIGLTPDASAGAPTQVAPMPAAPVQSAPLDNTADATPVGTVPPAAAALPPDAGPDAATASAPTAAPAPQCADGSSVLHHNRYHDCLVEAYDQAEQQLAKAQAAALAKIKSGPDWHENRKNSQALVASEMNFEGHEAMDCQTKPDSRKKGDADIDADAVLACQTKMMQDHIAELQQR